MCDVEELGGLRMGLVTLADHPHYMICLEDGHMVDTSKVSAALIPWYAEWRGNTNKFAPYVEPDTFIKLRRDMTQVGSYGVHIDAQHTALRLVNEAKAYAKAVKADDAGVPVHLWDDHIELVGVSPQVFGSALRAFQKLGWLRYIKNLRKDSTRFMKERHGDDWAIGPRRVTSELTELGRDQGAISNLLWHA